MKFTLEQINGLKSESKGGKDFPMLIQNFKNIGVNRFITYVETGYTEYFDDENNSIKSDALYDAKNISEAVNEENFEKQLRLHQQGGTDFYTFCQDCADNGIDHWIVDLNKMTCTYRTSENQEILIEQVPSM